MAQTDEAAKHATTQVSMPRGPLLLGIFGAESAPRALVRLPSGKVAEVGPGDRIGRAQVAGIDRETVILSQGGQTLRLSLP